MVFFRKRSNTEETKSRRFSFEILLGFVQARNIFLRSVLLTVGVGRG